MAVLFNASNFVQENLSPFCDEILGSGSVYATTPDKAFNISELTKIASQSFREKIDLLTDDEWFQ